MSKLNLEIPSELKASLKLGDKAGESDFLQAVTDLAAKVAGLESDKTLLEVAKTKLSNEKTELQTKLDNLTASANTDKVKELLDKYQGEKKFTNELKSQFEKDYATNPEGLEIVLKAMPKHSPVVDALSLKAEDVPAEYKDKTYDELHKAGSLPALKASHPEVFAYLYQQKFKKEYRAKAL